VIAENGGGTPFYCGNKPGGTEELQRRLQTRAAHVLGRSGYGCEISPAYCDVAIRRVQKLIGKPAVLESTGQSFDDVAAERKQVSA
jgi:hypothetical protein